MCFYVIAPLRKSGSKPNLCVPNEHTNLSNLHFAYACRMPHGSNGNPGLFQGFRALSPICGKPKAFDRKKKKNISLHGRPKNKIELPTSSSTFLNMRWPICFVGLAVKDGGDVPPFFQLSRPKPSAPLLTKGQDGVHQRHAALVTVRTLPAWWEPEDAMAGNGMAGQVILEISWLHKHTHTHIYIYIYLFF